MENLENLRAGSPPGAGAALKQWSPRAVYLRNRERLTTILLISTALLIWEVLARMGQLSPIIFPAPTFILSRFFESLIAGDYSEDFAISASRLLSGFLIGGGSGLILGLLMGWSRRLRKILDPIVAALHPIPKFALLPMIIIFFGIGESSRTAIISIGAFFPMLINSMAGVMQISPTYYEVVENYGASRWDIFRKVVLPGSLPFVLTGARLSLKGALTITIGVEMVFGNTGLGSLLWLSWETMRMSNMYSVLLIVSFCGFGLNWILEYSKRFLVPWHSEQRPA